MDRLKIGVCCAPQTSYALWRLTHNVLVVEITIWFYFIFRSFISYMEAVLSETSETMLCWSLSQNLCICVILGFVDIYWVLHKLMCCSFCLYENCNRDVVLFTLISPNNCNLNNIQTGLFRKKKRIAFKGYFYNWKKLFWFGFVIFGIFLDDCWTVLQNLKFLLINKFESPYVRTNWKSYKKEENR